MPELGEYLEGAYPTPPIEDEAARSAFVVDDDDKAAWAARKLARFQGDVDRMEQQARDEKAKIDAWLADATHGARGQVEWFEDLLAGYARRLHDADPDAPKTHKFLGGEVGRRKLPDRVVVTNEGAFGAWALENDPLLLSMKPSVNMVKAAVGRGLDRVDGDLVASESGELVPGVAYVEGGERYFGKAVG